ncbi:MAG: large repetitive protein, partial [Solirubrobacteraceae bacterium]|nr:large repetitive protein [Solirubrobacteraceae bacterium]
MAPRAKSLLLRHRRPSGLLLTAFVLLLAPPPTAQAAPCDPPVSNAILCENSLPGTPESVWGIDGSGDPSIQGFATAMSVTPGATIGFKIKSATAGYKIDVYRLGYYGGDGARRIDGDLVPTNTAAQPACATDSASGLIDCGNWSVSRSWTVPSTARSGVYVARLRRNDNGGASHITFVVRDDTSTSKMVYQTDDATWQAYNTWGGNSLYQCTVACPPGNPSAYKSAFKVSYNRPFSSAEDDVNGRSWIYHAEYPMIRFLERSGYDVSYISDVDTHARGALLKQHRLLVVSGHDEYWSQTMRDNVEAARDAGVNLAFFTGNEVFWRTRWEPSIAGGAVADRTLVTYKDTHFDAQVDPVMWTGTFRDPRFTTPANRPTPENALTGQSFLVNSGTSRIMVPQQYGRLRMWRNTAAATLPVGGSLALAPSTLGYEWDEDPDNGFRPAGQFRLSSTTVSGVDLFLDYGSFLTTGTATHNLTSYRAPSGARVFGAGTVQWSWGLDDYADAATDVNMQQATVNLFADMGAQPGALLPGLVAATPSTDATAPVSAISTPLAAATLTDGAAVAVTGIASDVGGQVAGVEVSTDGGATWHPATTGTTSWSYSWIVHGHPSTTIRTRAVDDSGNLETPSAGRTVSINCPCSIWGPNVTPPVADAADPGAIEAGVKFRSDIYGVITGVRFYKAAANVGTHIGSLWSTNGTRLAQATFSGESASGWQSVTFATPVAVDPGTTYIASYYAPSGHYSATTNYLYPDPAPGPNGGGRPDAAPLHALRDSGTTRNGVYAYSPTTTFPDNSFGASNYWVDVAFQPTAPPGAVSGVTATAGGRTSANVSWTAPSTGGAATAYTVTPYRGSAAQAPATVTGSPPATTTTVSGLTTGATYTFTVRASNPAGQGPESAASGPVTPLNPVVPAAPTNVLARPATQSALVSWTTPGSDGDSPITGYTITPYVGASAQPPVSAGASATSATVGALTNGTSYTFKVTATNAIGSGPASSASAPVTPQSTIFDFATPPTADSGEGKSLELGVKFTPSVNGTVTGVRFFKSAANTGVHVGSLWQTSGQRLAQANFSAESASGWQTVTFATPVAVAAGTTYVASYFTPSGHYAATTLPVSGVTNGPLTAVPDATTPNGVYAYGPVSAFPANSYNGANYWVDVLFAFPPPGQVTNVSAVEGGRTSATVSWSAPLGGGAPSAYRVTPYVGASPQSPTTISGAPPATSTTIGGLTSGTTYTFTVQALNANGGGPASAQSNAVTPSAAVVPPPPTQVRARPATKSALVSWSPPDGDGDSPITSYTVTPYIGATSMTPVTAGASATSATVSGLVNGSSYTFTVRATNAVGSGAASAPSPAVTPQSTIFDFASPSTVDGADGNPVELGVKFRADVNGSATGIRFYKAAANTGTHLGSLWTTTGTRLAQVTFTGETSSGWQHATFSSAVALTAGTTYVASYFAPNGHYSVSSSAFATTGVDNPPLHAVANPLSPDGVYAYTAASAFPT